MSSYINFSPVYSTASKSSHDTYHQGKAGNAHLVSAIIDFNLPILRHDPIDPTSLRVLGHGGSFIAHSGDLRIDIQEKDLFFAQGVYQDMKRSGGIIDKVELKVGDTVAVKSLNFQALDDAAEEGSVPDLTPIITEIAILSSPALQYFPHLTRLIGIGWKKVPRGDEEDDRHVPYLVTELGKRGNLTDFFRTYHREHTSMTHQVDFSTISTSMRLASNIDRNMILPWSLKITLSSALLAALQLLHHVGVVHGDIKMENVITTHDGKGFNWKLCDFGSSILLGETEKPYALENGGRLRLKSRSIPWDAPESKDLLSVAGLVKTDVYSFGMLFARIMLDGHDVFDPQFHVAIDAVPKRDQEVDQIKSSDRVVEHVMGRLKTLKSYNPGQLRAIQKVLSCTVRRDPADRIECMLELFKLVQKMIGLESQSTPHDRDKITLLDLGPCKICTSKSRFFAVEKPQAAKFHKIQSSSIRFIHYAMKEVVRDLEIMAAQGPHATPSSLGQIAQSNSNLAICHLHGIGTSYCPTEALKSARASGEILVSGMLSLAFARNPREYLGPKLVADVQKRMPEDNNLLISQILYSLDFESYQNCIKLTRSGPVDLITNQRYSISENLPAEEDSKEIGKFVLRPMNGSVAMPLWCGLNQLHHACIEGRIDMVERCLADPGTDVNNITITGNSPLWIACNCGHRKIVELLLTSGALATQVDSKFRLSPLHFLGRFDKSEIPEVGRLLKVAGGDPNAISAAKETPLMFLFNLQRNFRVDSRTSAAETLLKLGASPFGTSGEILDPSMIESPLRMASSTLSYNLFPLLHSEVCNRWQESTRVPILMTERAISHAQFRQALRLIGKRLQLDVQAFLWAVEGAVIYRVTENGKDFEHSLRSVLSIILSPAVRLVVRAMTGESAFLHSIRHQSFDIAFSILEHKLFCTADLENPETMDVVFETRSLDLVVKVIDAGIDCKMRNKRGQNLLHLAAIHGWNTAQLKTVCDLVRDRVDLRELVNGIDDQLNTPFDTCVLECKLSLAESMYHLGAKIDSSHHISVYGGATTLLSRCLTAVDEFEKLLQVRFLLGHDPSFRIEHGGMGSTALTSCWQPWRVQRKRLINPESHEVFSNDVVKLLLEHFPSASHVNQTNNWGLTPLHLAAASGNLPAVKLLLDQGADINATDNGRSTPLEAVGDELYRLLQESQPGDMYKVSGGIVSEITIEFYVFVEVQQYLQSRGALPGSQVVTQTPKVLDQDALRAEKVYSMILDENVKFPTSSSPSIMVTNIAPPPNRRDLGWTPIGLSIDQNLEYFEGPKRRLRRLLLPVLKPGGRLNTIDNVTREEIRSAVSNANTLEKIKSVFEEEMTENNQPLLDEIFAKDDKGEFVTQILEFLFL